MPRSTVNPGRLAALQVLLAVDRGEHAEDALARLAPAADAPPTDEKRPRSVSVSDRMLAWNLVFGVLRTRSALDSILEQAARRRVQNLDPEVCAVLRLGIYELRRTRVPPHAAVDQAVEMCRSTKAAHAGGFVNAVLRNQERFDPDAEARLGHPAWLLARWRARYGPEADRWMEANNEPPPTWIVATEDPAGVSRAFQHAGHTLVPGEAGTFRLPERSGRIDELPGFTEGRWWVMDPAAVAVADLVPPGGRVLDTCAAPGGKSFRIASRGAQVLATDTDATRLARVVEGAARLGQFVDTRVHDWTSGAIDGTFDAVIVDAPCTGLGTLRRHPDIRWRRQAADIVTAAHRQWKILQNAARTVKSGGALVYAVCSPEPEEGRLIAERLGWPIEAVYDNAPAVDGADVFWGCRMRAP